MAAQESNESPGSAGASGPHGEGFQPPDDHRRLPPVIGVLLAANILVFSLQLIEFERILIHFALWPLGTPEMIEDDGRWLWVPQFQIWQLVSYGFLHGGLLHLALNMFAVWMLGSQVARFWGTRLFIQYYLFCLVGAGMVQLLVASHGVLNDQIYPTVGASGAVFGVLLAFGMMFPNQRLFLIFLPIPIKAKYFVLLYGCFELWAGVTGTLAGIAHFAHLGGMAFGFLLIQYWRGRLPLRPHRRRLRW